MGNVAAVTKGLLTPDDGMEGFKHQLRILTSMNSDLVKIQFQLNSTDWHGFSNETLWAKALGLVTESNAFQLENSPFYCKGVSYLDVIRAVDHDGMFEFAGVIARSGHSTYRILFDREDDTLRAWWKKLQEIGCTYEGGDFRGKKLFSIDVPPTTNIDLVYSILEKGEAAKIWVFEEGHFAKATSVRRNS
ncbi:MAG TPA: DUF4265 domain-containing protein [Rhizomicrobium sp.]